MTTGMYKDVRTFGRLVNPIPNRGRQITHASKVIHTKKNTFRRPFTKLGKNRNEGDGWAGRAIDQPDFSEIEKRTKTKKTIYYCLPTHL